MSNQSEYSGQQSFPSPREFMKQRRPERFSDSQCIRSTAWSPNQLSYHLDTITKRSDENEFEEFARQLLKRVVAPNFSSQTGPMGGGDGKVDSDTYPVADDLALNWLVSEEMLAEAKERWALAASAKEDWKTKVRSDIKKIVDTGRGYTRAFFVTSRHTPAKDKHALQDSLEKLHGIVVTIFDREWIIDTVLSRQLEELFAKHLKYENPNVTIQQVLGPKDTARIQQIDENNNRIDKSSELDLMGPEAVHLAIENAILTRNLEKSIDDVELAFSRALRLAKKHSGKYAIRDCHYHWAWTVAWWHEDWVSFLDHYKSFESLIEEDCQYYDLERLNNLWNIVFSQTKAGRIELSEAELDKETENIRSKLKSMAQRTDLPNGSLSARTTLALMEITMDPSNASSSIKEIHSCINESAGRIEYSVSQVAEIVTELEQVLGDYDEFQPFFDDLVKISTERSQKSVAAEMLLKRCFGLTERNRKYQALVTAGQAIELLKDGENAELLTYALGMLSAIYEEIDLLWASRAAAITAFKVSRPSQCDPSNFSRIQANCLNRLKWIELKLGWIAHAVECHLHEAMITQTIEPDYREKSKYHEERTSFDAGIAIHLLRAKPEILEGLTYCPDNLDHVDLFFAASAGRHALGHPHEMPEEMDSSTDWFAAVLSQPIADQLNATVFIGSARKDRIETSIAGCRITVECEPLPEFHMLAKALVGFIEAFLATCMQNRIVPRSPTLDIFIEKSSDKSGGNIQYNMSIEGPSPVLHLQINISTNSVIDVVMRNEQKLREAAFMSIAHVFVIDDIGTQFSKIADEDNGVSRAADASRSLLGDSYIYGNNQSQGMQLLQKSDVKSYPFIERQYSNSPEEKIKDVPEPTLGDGPVPKDMHFDNIGHGDIEMPPVIRIHLWDAAKWHGTGFIGSEYGRMVPQFLFIFKQADKAKLLWTTLADDMAKQKRKNVLRLSIIQGVSASNPNYYRVTLSPGKGWLSHESDHVMMFIGRSCTMEPGNSENLTRFIDQYRIHKKCELHAAVIHNGQPVLVNTVPITYDEIEFRQAYEIGLNDLDAPFIRENDEVFIPEGINNAPVLKLIAKRRSS